MASFPCSLSQNNDNIFFVFLKSVFQLNFQKFPKNHAHPNTELLHLSASEFKLIEHYYFILCFGFKVDGGSGGMKGTISVIVL